MAGKTAQRAPAKPVSVPKKIVAERASAPPPQQPKTAQPQKIEMPSHQYVLPEAAPWPKAKIMQQESEKTYARLHPITQWWAILGFAIVLFVLALLWLLVAIALSAFPGALWFLTIAAAFLAFPSLAAYAINTLHMLRTYRFSLQEQFLFVRSGTINPTYHMIPYENIQDAQVSQGLLDGLFNVAAVTVSTPASSLTIYALGKNDAQKFREDLLSLARMHKNMAE